MADMNNIKIKRCGLKDIELVGKFYDDEILYMDEYALNYPKWIYGTYPSKDSVRDAAKVGTQYFCTVGRRVCGAFVLDENPGGFYQNGDWKADLQPGEYLIIHALCVAHEFSGRGIGRSIVNYCIGYAKSVGYKAVRIDVVPDNFPAIRLYKKMGFTYAGEKDLGRNLKNIPTFALYEFNF